ncbi:acid protease [Fomitiporia mediterranea MF3/22]|uniref:acid protease n=1 Tax=Fomitiporia mediterranea (strain MF3/22) TaxID=694068 RepID=UPI00044097DE|nr:acid protease [Fomitiporia mediterranea MF3/22]EJD04479.1 acid protease [Fomitiporia mediterranea MF3/22]
MANVQGLTFVAARAAVLLLLISILLATHGANALSLSKRDAVIATVNIPLTVNKDKRYVVGVNMSSSSLQQSFRFAMGLNTGLSAVAGIGCDSCNNVPAYNASASTSQKPFPGSANVSLGSASVGGPFIKEDCFLHEANGTGWSYPNQTIIVANQSSSFFTDVTSGLIGLGTNANGQSGNFSDTVFGGWLSRNPSQNNFTFGMDLRSPKFTSDNDQGNGGVLHWLQPDSKAYQGNIAWSTAGVSSGPANVPANQNTGGTSSNAAFQLPESDWSIQLDGWAASVAGSSIANASKTTALIEPFFADIFFPASQANLLYAAVPSAVQTSSLVDGAQAWSLPCNTKLSVAFTFSGQSFPLDESQLIEQQSDGSCIGTIKAWPDSSVTNFMLGSNFISSLYLIFVVGRPGSGVPNSVGIVPRAAQSSKTDVGAIVGGTIGGVVGVAILVGGAYMLGRRRRAKTSKKDGDASPSKIGEKTGFVANHNKDEGSDEGGAQYATHALPHYGPQKYSPSTPSTAYTARPLLPEAHDYRNTAFDVPNSPHSGSNFLAMSSGGSSSGHGHTLEPSTASRISYNPNALGANVTANRASSSYGTGAASMDPSGRTHMIEPFTLPAGASPPSTRDHKSIPQRTSVSPSTANQIHMPQPQPAPVPGSPQDLDPFSPSTASGGEGAVNAPFILPPPPSSPRSRVTNKQSLVSSRAEQQQQHAQVPRSSETPAPPYSFEAPTPAQPVSPTLVEYSESNAGGSSSGPGTSTGQQRDKT